MANNVVATTAIEVLDEGMSMVVGRIFVLDEGDIKSRI
jgi:hypothetical protein